MGDIAAPRPGVSQTVYETRGAWANSLSLGFCNRPFLARRDGHPGTSLDAAG